MSRLSTFAKKVVEALIQGRQKIPGLFPEEWFYVSEVVPNVPKVTAYGVIYLLYKDLGEIRALEETTRECLCSIQYKNVVTEAGTTKVEVKTTYCCPKILPKET